MNSLTKAIAIGFLFLFLGCEENYRPANSNKILLLKIDFVTQQFEGGRELSFSTEIPTTDSIPILVDYDSPADFGNISLFYQSTNDSIFDGSIIWMGTGDISFPTSFEKPESFMKLQTPLSLPDQGNFQIIFYDLYNVLIDYEAIWNAINELQIVSEYLQSGKKIGLFLYTPSVGDGDPNEWDWFIIMNRDSEGKQ